MWKRFIHLIGFHYQLMISDNWLCKRYDKVNGLSMYSMDRYTQALFSADGPQHRRKHYKIFLEEK